MSLTEEMTVRQAEDQISSKLDNEAVLMSIDNGEYYKMNPIATDIWEMISNPKKISDIINTLLQEYDVSKEKCAKEVFEFLNHLNEKNLISVSQ